MADVEDLNQSGKRVKSNNSSNEEDKEVAIQSQSPKKGQSDSVNPFVSPDTRGMTPIEEEDESALRRQTSMQSGIEEEGKGRMSMASSYEDTPYEGKS